MLLLLSIKDLVVHVVLTYQIAVGVSGRADRRDLYTKYCPRSNSSIESFRQCYTACTLSPPPPFVGHTGLDQAKCRSDRLGCRRWPLVSFDYIYSWTIFNS